jgi:hypothetical protein
LLTFRLNRVKKKIIKNQKQAEKMFQDSTLQIFLSVYHGSMVGAFFYDYVIRNAVRLFLKTGGSDHMLTYIGNIALGVIAIAFLIWAILSVWSKIRRNLLITLVVLLILFIIRLAIGIKDISDRRNDTEFTVVLVTQLVVHLLGVIGTWILANNSA